MSKVNKASVNYRPSRGLHRCGTCSMYDQHTCSLVEGKIDSGAVCDKWEAK